MPNPAFLPPCSTTAKTTFITSLPHCIRRRPLHRTVHRSPTASLPDSDPSPLPDTPDASHPSYPPSQVSFSTGASSAATLTSALTEAASRALANLAPGGPPDLAIVFVSVRYSVANVGPAGRDSLDLVVPKLRALVPALRAVVGCTGDGVIGAGPTGDVVELEDGPSLSVTLARLPGINVSTFHVMPDDLPSLDTTQAAWRAMVRNPDLAIDGPSAPPAFIILCDPTFSERGELSRFLSGLEFAYPGSSVVGALASTGAGFSKGHLYCTLPRDVLSGDSTSLRDSGLVGISLTGDVQLDCLVSPGCRPIGPLFEVRKVSDGNVLSEMELVGRPSTSLSAVGHLKSIISYATPIERRLIQSELHIGVAIDQVATGDTSEDYLIRHVLGVDMGGGGIAVGRTIRPGQRVRFFVKEADLAKEKLDKTMQKYKRVELANSLVGYSNPPFGAMVFVDAGRGRTLFREPRMETRNLESFAAGVPISGFFSGGQIGPSRSGEDGRNSPSVLHNAANLIALVRRRSRMSSTEPILDPPVPDTETRDGPE